MPDPIDRVRVSAQTKAHRSYGPLLGPVVRWTGVAIGLSGFALLFYGVLKADEIRSWLDADYVLLYLTIGSVALGVSNRMVRSVIEDSARRKSRTDVLQE